MQVLSSFLSQFKADGFLAITFAAAIAAGLIAHRILFSATRRIIRRSSSPIDDLVVKRLEKPIRFALPLITASLALRGNPEPGVFVAGLQHLLGLGFIASIAWSAIALLSIGEDYLAIRFKVDVKDNLTARRVHTQFHVLHRISVVVICILALSIMLMTFPSIRQIGTSILASAGLAGLVIGMAMRSTLSNLIAGIQIALTQPIRLEDVVIVEGEWGWIEEFGTTYVVVRVWDLRRLVVPLSYFVEKPFQNWTHKSADLLAYVYLYTDYAVPVDELRQELERILRASPLWRGKVCGLQVTDAKERTLELRALMDAQDSGTAWDLRCEVREKLIRFLQERYPDALPRSRVEMTQERDLAPQLRRARNGSALPVGNISD
jgi:small-conductance mechanosensitive channel